MVVLMYVVCVCICVCMCLWLWCVCVCAYAVVCIVCVVCIACDSWIYTIRILWFSIWFYYLQNLAQNLTYISFLIYFRMQNNIYYIIHNFTKPKHGGRNYLPIILCQVQQIFSLMNCISQLPFEYFNNENLYCSGKGKILWVNSHLSAVGRKHTL